MAGELDAQHPIYGPFFGVMGAASAMIFSGKCFICRGIGFHQLLSVVHPSTIAYVPDALAKSIDFLFCRSPGFVYREI